MADLISEAELVAARPELAGSPDLAALIAASTAAIEGHCRRTLALGPRVDTFSLDFPAGSVWLRSAPVAAIASVSLDGQVLDPATYSLASPETGELVRGSGRSRRAWPSGLRHLVVAYSAGYDPIPADLRRAAIHWVVDLVDAPGRITSEKIGDYSYSVAADESGISPVVARLLARYRLPRVTSGDC